jgi:hypothetical protein
VVHASRRATTSLSHPPRTVEPMFGSGADVGGAGVVDGAARGASSALDAAVDGLVTAVDAVAACDAAAEPAAVALMAYVRLRRLRDVFDAVVAGVGAVADARGEWRADGSRSMAARVAREGGEPDDVARRDVRLARALVDLPGVATAFAAGELSRAHVDVLVHASGGVRRTLFLRDEELLVGFARDLAGTAFRHAVRAWVLAADDELAPDDPGALDLESVGVDERRWFAVRDLLDGRSRLEGELGRLDGAQFGEAHRRVEREMFEADWREARERLGRDPTVADLGRSSGQRRADALVELAIRGARARPGAKRPRPLVTVLMGSERHAQLLQLSRGTPITLREGLRAMLDGEIERATFETPNRVQISEKARLFTGATRRAVEVREITCSRTFTTSTGRELRCDVPSDECEIDHAVPVEDGGRTTQENGRARCVDDHDGRRRHQPWLEAERRARATRRRPGRRRRRRRDRGSGADDRPP